MRFLLLMNEQHLCTAQPGEMYDAQMRGRDSWMKSGSVHVEIGFISFKSRNFPSFASPSLQNLQLKMLSRLPAGALKKAGAFGAATRSASVCSCQAEYREKEQMVTICCPAGSILLEWCCTQCECLPGSTYVLIHPGLEC